MKSLQAKIAAAMAGYDQAKARADAWSSRLPDHFRLGDVLIVNPEGIKSSPSFLWMLVKHHPDNDRMFYAVIVDDRENMVGLSDVVLDAAVHTHVARPTVGTWVHSDDLRLANRIDHAPAGQVQECCQWIGKAAPEFELEDGVQVRTKFGNITFAADDRYIEHILDLRAWDSVITSCLHDVDADPLTLSQNYWDWIESRD